MPSIPRRGIPRSAEAVYAIIRDMTPEERYVLFSLLASVEFRGIVPDEFIVREEAEVTDLLEKIMAGGDEARAALVALQERLDPMIQKPRKTRRYELFHKYLKDGLTDQQAYDAILAEHADLLTIGKGKRAKQTQLATMKREYNKWLKATGTSRA